MFSVIFEVQPRAERWDAYLGHARMLRPELEEVDGFVDNHRYRSLTRPGWLLSLSGWRDEKAVVRWRTRMRHHAVQEQGRADILADYHLRVGQVTADTRVPAGHALREQRLDETERGAGTTVTVMDAVRSRDWVAASAPDAVAASLGFAPGLAGLVAFDVFDAILAPGDALLLMTWRETGAADAFAAAVPPDGVRLRQVRVVRDYGMYDRHEAPQYYPDVQRRAPAPDAGRAGGA